MVRSSTAARTASARAYSAAEVGAAMPGTPTADSDIPSAAAGGWAAASEVSASGPACNETAKVAVEAGVQAVRADDRSVGTMIAAESAVAKAAGAE